MTTDISLSIPVYLGTGGNKPGILKYDGMSIDEVLTVDPGHSVYAISLSPGKKRLAFGTRNRLNNDKYGKVIIYEIDQESGQISKKLLNCFQPTSVTSICMISEDMAISGGIDGRLSMWDVSNPNVAKFQFQGHHGAVFSIKKITSNKYASLGYDGKVKLWEGEGKFIREFSDPGNPVMMSHLIDIQYIPEIGSLLVHYLSGNLCLYVIEGDDGKSENQKIIYKSAKASCLVGDTLVIIGVGNSAISTYKLPNFEESDQVQSEGTALGMVGIDYDKFIIIFDTNKTEVWQVKPLEKLDIITSDNIRTCGEMPRESQLTMQKGNIEKRKEELLTGAKNALANDDVNEINEWVNRLIEAGLGIEGNSIFATWCRRHSRPIWELDTRMNICREIPIVEQNAMHFYNFATLLERVNEPLLALEYYERTLECQNNYKKADERVKLLKSKLKDYPKGDKLVLVVENINKALQEVQKKAAINVKITGSIAIKCKSLPVVLKGKTLTINDLLEVLPKEKWEPQNNYAYTPGRKPEKKDWAYYQTSEENTDNSTSTFAVSINRIENSVILDFYYIINLKVDVKIQDHLNNLQNKSKQMRSEKFELRSNTVLKQVEIAKRKIEKKYLSSYSTRRF